MAEPRGVNGYVKGMIEEHKAKNPTPRRTNPKPSAPKRDPKIDQKVYHFLQHNHPCTTAQVLDFLVKEGIVKRNDETHAFVVSFLNLEARDKIEADWWIADELAADFTEDG